MSKQLDSQQNLESRDLQQLLTLAHDAQTTSTPSVSVNSRELVGQIDTIADNLGIMGMPEWHQWLSAVLGMRDVNKIKRLRAFVRRKTVKLSLYEITAIDTLDTIATEITESTRLDFVETVRTIITEALMEVEESPKTDPPKTDPPKTDPPKTDRPKTNRPKTNRPKTNPPAPNAFRYRPSPLSLTRVRLPKNPPVQPKEVSFKPQDLLDTFPRDHSFIVESPPEELLNQLAIELARHHSIELRDEQSFTEPIFNTFQRMLTEIINTDEQLSGISHCILGVSQSPREMPRIHRRRLNGKSVLTIKIGLSLEPRFNNYGKNGYYILEFNFYIANDNRKKKMLKLTCAETAHKVSEYFKKLARKQADEIKRMPEEYFMDDISALDRAVPTSTTITP